MKLTLIAAFALTATLPAPVAAYAYDTGHTTALDLQRSMAQFFSDKDMTTLRDEKGFNAMVWSMPAEDRDTLRSMCTHDNTDHTRFCVPFMKALKRGS